MIHIKKSDTDCTRIIHVQVGEWFRYQGSDDHVCFMVRRSSSNESFQRRWYLFRNGDRCPDNIISDYPTDPMLQTIVEILPNGVDIDITVK